MDDLRKKSYQQVTIVVVFGLLACIVCLGILLSMCSEGNQSNNQSALDAHSWYLTSYLAEAAETPVIEKTDVIIAFNANGKVSGSSGCNIYFGDYALSGDTLQIQRIESTQMTSRPEVLDQERIFFSLLQKTKTYIVDGNCLRLFDALGNPILSFTGQPQPLSGREWYLGYSWNNTDGIIQKHSTDQISVQFLAENKLRGVIADSDYCGTYEADEDFIHFTSAEVCSKYPTSIDERAELSAWYLSLLKQAHRYMISGSQLDIVNEGGHCILSFTRIPLPLVLTDWYPQKYRAANGSGFIPMMGAYDLITFMPEGKVVGTFQEIPFSATYDADNSSISFGPVAMLITEDDDPVNADDSKRAIELIFEEARTYMVRNGSLELSSGDGEVLLIMANMSSLPSLPQEISPGIL